MSASTVRPCYWLCLTTRPWSDVSLCLSPTVRPCCWLSWRPARPSRSRCPSRLRRTSLDHSQPTNRPWWNWKTMPTTWTPPNPPGGDDFPKCTYVITNKLYLNIIYNIKLISNIKLYLKQRGIDLSVLLSDFNFTYIHHCYNLTESLIFE